jgi:hypothetical protein
MRGAANAKIAVVAIHVPAIGSSHNGRGGDVQCGLRIGHVDADATDGTNEKLIGSRTPEAVHRSIGPDERVVVPGNAQSSHCSRSRARGSVLITDRDRSPSLCDGAFPGGKRVDAARWLPSPPGTAP